MAEFDTEKQINRWQPQETLALIRVRSEMDAAFRVATDKTLFWEQLSIKLRELGYSRSAQKCKEKFDNIYNYYKRTKDVRSDRRFSKSNEIFAELGALHDANGSQTVLSPEPISMLPPANTVGVNFLLDSSEGEDEDEEKEAETVDRQSQSRKRKRGDQRMMEFVEGLMKKVLQKQEAMHQKLETIVKREQDRMIIEEAWKKQELERLAEERLVSASRHAAIVKLLQKIPGQTIQSPAVINPNNPLTRPSVRENYRQTLSNQDLSGASRLEHTSPRWLDSEVFELIQLRSRMEYSWEEISAAMQRMGYDRSAKICKKKWSNMHVYYKKVKDSIKERPEEVYTCTPYYHELDALYQKNAHRSIGESIVGSGASSSSLPVTWSTQQQQKALLVSGSVDKHAGGKNVKQTSNVGANQAEGSVRKQLQLSHGTTCNLGNNVDDSVSCDLKQEDDEFNNEEDTEEEMKAVSKIQFRTEKVGSCNGVGQAPNSVLAIFQ